MSIYEAYIVLYKHQMWRLSAKDAEFTDPKKLTQAITKLLKHIYPQLVEEQDKLRQDLPTSPDIKEQP